MEISIAGNEVSRISWLVSLRTLLVGTGGTEWEVKSNAGALTASDISLVPQSYRGSSRLPALIIGSSVLHINRTQREMHDLVYDFGTDSYSGSDHAVLAGHLFANRAITDWAYQQSPDSVIWCVRDDGALLGHTFLREHEVFAWHRHDTQGKFIAVCSLPGASADEVFFVVEREIGEQKHYFLERMEHNRQNTPQEDMSASSLFTWIAGFPIMQKKIGMCLSAMWAVLSICRVWKSPLSPTGRFARGRKSEPFLMRKTGKPCKSQGLTSAMKLMTS